MTAASDAYAEAQRLIAAAAESGATALSFNTAKSHALTRIPKEINTLTALTTLDLSGTKVTDLTPIAALTALTALNLRFTKVTDLIPIAALTALTTLNLSSTEVADLRPLLTLKKLATEPQVTNGPEPRPAPQALAADGGVDKGWSRHRRRTVEAFHALDRSDLRVTGGAGPGVNRWSLIAGVDGELGQLHDRTTFMRPRPQMGGPRCGRWVTTP